MPTPFNLLCGSVASMLIVASLDVYGNRVRPHEPYEISPDAETFHHTLVIGDLHADSTLWGRDLTVRNWRGHVDLPRLREGNVALQMFTTVTKSPTDQNYDNNSSDSFDDVGLLALAQCWPKKTWSNLTERALFQASRIRQLAEDRPEEVQLVLSQEDLERVLEDRANGSEVLGALLGTEGSHALEGDIANVEKLYDAGFRMMSLHHFFDNALGGSLHGTLGGRLTEFGKMAVHEMQRLGVMIDVSHSSEEVVEDVLDVSDSPLIVSHTGFHGHCGSARNISDELMVRIANAGGLIAVGFWDGAVCDNKGGGATPANIAQAIHYGIDLVGVEHVALGSDFDGSTETHLDVSEIAVLTHELFLAGVTEAEIRRVMGENMVSFLRNNLPNDGD